MATPKTITIYDVSKEGRLSFVRIENGLRVHKQYWYLDNNGDRLLPEEFDRNFVMDVLNGTPEMTALLSATLPQINNFIYDRMLLKEGMEDLI